MQERESLSIELTALKMFHLKYTYVYSHCSVLLNTFRDLPTWPCILNAIFMQIPENQTCSPFLINKNIIIVCK